MKGITKSDYAWIFGIGIALMLSGLDIKNYSFLSFAGVVFCCRGILQMVFPNKFVLQNNEVKK